MGNDPQAPVVLTTATSEACAALLIAALENAGIQAHLEGALTSGYRAEAPGGVRILVRQGDLQAARDALRALESGGGARPS